VAGAAVTIDALANDSDPEGGAISLSGVSLPGHGGLTLTPDHRWWRARTRRRWQPPTARCRPDSRW
jgi:hypothetical protein